MNYTERRIVDSYSKMFDGLSDLVKIELIKRLVKSLKKKNKARVENELRKTFGAWPSEKPAEEIIEEIRSGRTSINWDIKL